MEKQRILREIKRIADASGNKPPGTRAFERETGIKTAEWYPHLWLRWGDALAEAGYAPNLLQSKLDDSVLLERYAELIRELRRLPVEGEIRRKARIDKTFPSHTVFARFGGKKRLVEAVASFCRSKSGYDDVINVCETHLRASHENTKPLRTTTEDFVKGVVYLIKSGRHYKIGRTNALGRREWELSIKIPVPPRTVHTIETDDPVGVEAYWHKRFAEKRGEGEWFELSLADVAAFKRWKRIV